MRHNLAGTPASFRFAGDGRTWAVWIRPDLIRLGDWTASVGLALGPLSIARKSERGEPTSRHRALFARGGCGTARLLRSSVPDAGIRKYFTVQSAAINRA